MMRLLYLFVLVPFAVTASEHYATSDAPQTAIQAYSHAARLVPLHASDEDTLRIWTRDYMSGQIRGHIITMVTSKSCLASSSYSNGSITIARVRCNPSRKAPEVNEAIRALPAFSRPEWNCPAFDGYEVFIEGVRRHKYFAIRVSNPQVCDDPESEAIVALLGKLE
ncbi:hypothetical protein [Frateuria soli]|uniref:hypothetical protein n=1 Tax=Frateuria soli TaxID=1542730 RepID=UPI001E2DAAE1|nr:hypothetical protein [Frateuria soli]UGB39222.1 hypothetical protein LQ771_05085 [Frateuria soli]